MTQFLETTLICISLFIALMIDTCLIHVQENNFFKFHLTVKIDLVEEVYYLKQVFHLLFLKFHLTVKVDLDEVVYYLKQVFHLLYDLSVTPVDALPYFSLIS